MGVHSLGGISAFMPIAHYIQLDWTPSIITTKNINPPKSRKGCDNSETTIEKLLARRIQICLVYFCNIYF